MVPEGSFEAGERVLLVDLRGRRYLVTLASGKQFHSHLGAVEHNDLIGASPGSSIATTGGSRLLAFRPTLGDYVLKMGRGAQIVYPKDLGLIVMYGDVFPGARVLEAGTGSGALTLALARAVGESGRVVSYEVRQDHHDKARANIEEWFAGAGGKPDNIELRVGNVFEDVGNEHFDRMILDLPEPWRAAGSATRALVPGGIACCYVPTIPQVIQTVEALRLDRFALVDAFEGLVRTWNVAGQSVRPDHRMVAHTGFIVTARKRDPTSGGVSGGE